MGEIDSSFISFIEEEERFFEYYPFCKECLVRSMCLGVDKFNRIKVKHACRKYLDSWIQQITT